MSPSTGAKFAVGLSTRGLLSRLTGRILEEQGASVRYVHMQFSDNVNRAFGWSTTLSSFDRAAWAKESGKDLSVVDLTRESEAWLEAQALRCLGQFWIPDLRGLFDSEFLVPQLGAWAERQGLPRIATGHRARLTADGDKDVVLARSRDVEHDQSSWLAQRGWKSLRGLALPLGYLKLSEIDRLCNENGITSESGFAGESERLLDAEKLRALLDTRSLSRVKTKGFVIDDHHHVLAEHAGLIGFFPGSRHGLDGLSGVPSGFVPIGHDLGKQWLVVGPIEASPALKTVVGTRTEWCTRAPKMFAESEVLEIQVGFRAPLVGSARVRLLADSMLQFDAPGATEPLPFATGRRITVYRGAHCLGSTQAL